LRRHNPSLNKTNKPNENEHQKVPGKAGMGNAVDLLTPTIRVSKYLDITLNKSGNLMSNKMTYTPVPLSTDDIDLPDNLKPLVERIAEHVHDVWSRKRIEEGWSYGPQRDDKRKENPSLIAYKQLSESEKDYDRETVKETIKAALLLGYDVVKVD
jgi:hypothetical protein